MWWLIITKQGTPVVSPDPELLLMVCEKLGISKGPFKVELIDCTTLYGVEPKKEGD